ILSPSVVRRADLHQANRSVIATGSAHGTALQWHGLAMDSRNRRRAVRPVGYHAGARRTCGSAIRIVMTSRRVPTTISYLHACEGKPTFYGRQRTRDHLPLKDYAVTVEDLRTCDEAPTLDREGFALVPHRSAITNVIDPGARAAYRRELETLVQALTGATRVVAFTNGAVRRSERSSRFGQDGTTVPGRFAHCDFSPNPAGSRVWLNALLP